MSKIDFGQSHWVKTSDTFAREPFVPAPDNIQPRPPGLAQPTEFRASDEALRQAVASYAETRATAEAEIKNLEAMIRTWRDRVQVARDRLSSIQGC